MSDVRVIPTVASDRRSIAIFLLAVVVLEIVTYLRMPCEWSSEWDQATAMIVTNSVSRKVTQGLSVPLAESYEADLKHTVSWNGAPPDRHYLKQFGGAVVVLAAFAPSDPARLERYLLSARYVAAGFSTLVIATLLTLLARRSGLVAAVALLAFLADDQKYLSFPSFLRSLYWLPGLSLLPLVVMLALYSHAAPVGRRRWAMLLFGSVVGLRALCGYEYISVPVLMACAAIIYRASGAPLRALVGDFVRFVVAGGIGTALAIAVHAVSLYRTFGSWAAAYENTIGNAIRRSFGEHELMSHVNSSTAQFRGIRETLTQNVMLSLVIGLWFAALIGYAVRAKRRTVSPPSKRDVLLKSHAFASLAAFFSSASWLVLMRSHAALHPQYNSLAFYQGFIWFAIPFIVMLAADIHGGIGAKVGKG